MQAFTRRIALASALGLFTALSGCAVLMVAGAAASVAATGVGLAADAAVGTVRLTGKAVGAAVDVLKPSAPTPP